MMEYLGIGLPGGGVACCKNVLAFFVRIRTVRNLGYMTKKAFYTLEVRQNN